MICPESDYQWNLLWRFVAVMSWSLGLVNSCATGGGPAQYSKPENFDLVGHSGPILAHISSHDKVRFESLTNFSAPMCHVTRNRFSCTQTDRIHLLLDHSHASSVCEKRNLCPENLKRFCSDAFFFDKSFEYACNLCVNDSDGKRKELLLSFYA